MRRRGLPLVIIAILGFAGCGGERGPPVIATDYELPAGYTGWVTIQFAVAGAPPLASRDGVRQVVVPASGILATATPQRRGVVKNRFYYVDDARQRTPIEWPESRYGADPQTADRTFARPVVLRLVTGDATVAGRRDVFEQFYVGRGPAGDPPGPP